MPNDQDAYSSTHGLVDNGVGIDPHRKRSSLLTRRGAKTRIGVEERRYTLKFVEKSSRDSQAGMPLVEPEGTFEILLSLTV